MVAVRKGLMLAVVAALAACRIEITVPATGVVTTESGAYECNQGATCRVEVADTHFQETFTAQASDGHQFIGWKREKGRAMLCGGMTVPCGIRTDGFAGNEILMSILNSDELAYLEPVFIPEDHTRVFQPGDVITYAGSLVLQRQGAPESVADITVRREFSTSPYTSYLDKQLLKVRSVTAYVPGDYQEVVTTTVWQEENGALFDYKDSYDNTYLTVSENENGLASIPSPLVPTPATLTDFNTLYGGNTSGAVTRGTRSIYVEAAKTVAVPLGEFRAYKVIQVDDYEYVFSFADNKPGTSIRTEREMWVTAAKGIIKYREVQSEYASSGTLQMRRILDLDAVRTNY